MAKPRNSKPEQQSGPGSTSQLRGEALERRIEAVVRELAAQADKEGREYIFNASQVAEIVPTTRKTLRKHGDFIESLLDALKARRRMVTGEATVEHLREQLAYLKDQIAERDKTILSLRTHHVEIYERLYAQSIDAGLLVQPILARESEEKGECLLCGRGGDDPGQFKRRTDVVPLERRKNR